MKKVDQKNCNNETGDCLRACVASLIELPLEAVPNFSLIPSWNQLPTLTAFLWSQGYTYGDNLAHNLRGAGVDNCWIASVPSRSFKGCSHAVIINHEGLVVHDPNPNRKWLGEEVFVSKSAMYVRDIQPRDDEEWTSFLRGESLSAGYPRARLKAKMILIRAFEKVLALRTEAGNEAALIMIRDYLK